MEASSDIRREYALVSSRQKDATVILALSFEHVPVQRDPVRRYSLLSFGQRHLAAANHLAELRLKRVLALRSPCAMPRLRPEI